MDVYSFTLEKNKKYIRRLLMLFILYIIYAFSEIYLFSYLISTLIKSLNKNINYVNSVFKNITLGLIFYLLAFYAYKSFHINTMVNFKIDIRKTLFNLIIKSNDNSFIDKNYPKFHSMINRFSLTSFIVYNYLSTYALPSIIYTIILLLFLFKSNTTTGFFLLIVNFIMLLFIVTKIKSMGRRSIKYEIQNTTIETKQIEKLTLIDKITNRGFSDIENKLFNNYGNRVTNKGIIFYNYMLNNETFLLALFNISIFIVIYLLFINKVQNKILIITLLLLYRNKVDISIQKMNEIIDHSSRIYMVGKNIENEFISNYYSNVKKIHKIDYTNIKFNNISFKYKNKYEKTLENFNLEIDFNKNKIISIMGRSGKGKSTLCKLLIKIYKLDKGEILINDINIHDIDSKEIKKKITYINQNSKLFNEDIEYNLNYGCYSPLCKKYIKEIINTNNLQTAFNNKIGNIKKIKTGFLGENISGGQRQIINVLNGLIYPSDILILDEPTNSLSYSLKIKLLKTIKEFKKYKKGILIITHDKDVLSIVDKNIYI